MVDCRKCNNYVGGMNCKIHGNSHNYYFIEPNFVQIACLGKDFEEVVCEECGDFLSYWNFKICEKCGRQNSRWTKPEWEK